MTRERKDQLPLENVRVLDLSRLFPGPLCTMWLADFGADVIKVEEPRGGDGSRQTYPFYREQSGYFINLNRNKRSLCLDLKQPAGQEALHRLVEKVDVVVESFRLGVAERLNVGYEQLAKINPRLVYCSISGFGRQSRYRHVPGHNLTVLGLVGALHGSLVPEQRPELSTVPIADFGGSVAAVFGILVALIARSTTGRGQFIDAAMSDAVLNMSPVASANVFTTGRSDGTAGFHANLGLVPRYSTYQGSDGKWLTLACLEKSLWERFCKVVGREDLFDPSETAEDRGRVTPERKERLFHELRQLFQSRTRDEWVDLLSAQEVPCLPANHLKEALDSAAEDGLLLEYEYPGEGLVRNLGFLVNLSETHATLRRRPPLLGEHSEEILAAAGYSSNDIAELFRSGVSRCARSTPTPHENP